MGFNLVYISLNGIGWHRHTGTPSGHRPQLFGRLGTFRGRPVVRDWNPSAFAVGEEIRFLSSHRNAQNIAIPNHILGSFRGQLWPQTIEPKHVC